MPFCPRCGTEVNEEASFCPNCGHALIASTIKPLPQVPSGPERITQRPTGITIIAALNVLGGLIFLGLGTLVLLAAVILGTGFRAADFPIFAGISGAVLGIIGGVLVIIGLINFVIAYGYWIGSGWAWTVGMVFAVLEILLGLLALPQGVVSIILNGLIVYYLTRQHVKAFFLKNSSSYL
ncbi:MAG: hypothetical protein QG670_1370 [Thermoproteota archaeon]|nr:hypothetical protein [Thermoproteota archaeon]